MGFGDVDDDYDPAKPNDYMEYCRERLNKKKQEERDRELKVIMEEQEREVSGTVSIGSIPTKKQPSPVCDTPPCRPRALWSFDARSEIFRA